MKKIIALILILFIWQHFYYIPHSSPVGPGITAGGAPYITPTDQSNFREDSLTFYPKASFQGEVRVLAASHYYFDRASIVSPYAMVVGWEELSDESYISQYDISHFERSFSWESDTHPLDINDVPKLLSNLNIIPATSGVKAMLSNIKIGDLVEIEGYIVDVKSATGWRWSSAWSGSSKRRIDTDQGNEIIYVKSLKVINAAERINQL